MSVLPYSAEVEIVLLLASPVHRYEGRPSDGPLPAVGEETHQSIRLRAGLGIVGDRHFGKPAHRHASVTVMNANVLDLVADDLGIPRTLDPVATRRNILLRGVNGDLDVDGLRGATFSLTAATARSSSGRTGRRTRAPGWTWCSPPAPTGPCAGVAACALNR